MLEVNTEGFIVDNHVANVDEEGNILDEEKQSFILRPVEGLLLYKPRYNFDKELWEEGITEQELADLEEQARLASLIPTTEQIQESELEIKILTLLVEMEVI